ncbi:MAG: Abi family protein [Oscillospiraceae bacterium]|jgi:abortive infection bacteriophage resistance protein|nr:Abi family protein [Oscillospiraceae bacterium]
MDIKSPTTYEGQIEKIKSRGCVIDDEAFCKDILSRINYYRLTAYFLPFRNKDRDTYRAGTSFIQVYMMYEFDRRLRALVYKVIEEIEIYVRSKAAYYHGHKFGALGYKNLSNFNGQHNHEKFIGNINNEIEHSREVPFVKHHIQNYNGQLPFWVATELFSFGMLSRFYSDLLTTDRKILAKDMFNQNERIVKSWLYCCSSLRNICAHYGRLYYRDLGAVPATPKDFSFNFNRKLYSSIMMLKLMQISKDKWNSEFVHELKSLIDQYEHYIELKHIGFPPDWEAQLLIN